MVQRGKLLKTITKGKKQTNPPPARKKQLKKKKQRKKLHLPIKHKISPKNTLQKVNPTPSSGILPFSLRLVSSYFSVDTL